MVKTTFSKWLLYFFIGYLTGLSPVSLCPRRSVRRIHTPEVNIHWMPSCFWMAAPELTIGDIDPPLKETIETLHNYLRQRGFGPALKVLSDNSTRISIESPDEGDRHSRKVGEERLSYYFSEHQLPFHGRDIQMDISFWDYAGSLQMGALVIKGSGRHKPPPFLTKGFLIHPARKRPIYIRPPQALDKLNPFQPASPIDQQTLLAQIIQLYEERDTLETHLFVGGMEYEFAKAEYIRMAAIHKLLLAIDGKPAGVPIPVRINLLTQLPILDDDGLRVINTEDYLTDPHILNWAELMTVALELRERVKDDPKELRIANRYLHLLCQPQYVSTIEEHHTLMNQVRRLIKREFLLVTLTKFQTSNIRVSEWSVYRLFPPIAYIQRLYGEDLTTLDSLERVAERFTHSLARTIGAIHGAGGTFSAGSNISSVDSKDITLAGEMVDLGDSGYIPFNGADIPDSSISSRISRAQDKDIEFLELAINEFCDKLTYTISFPHLLLPGSTLYTIPSLRDNLYKKCLRYFHEVYNDYYHRAQEYIQNQDIHNP